MHIPNSIQVIPKDQTSTFPSYWPSSIARMTSGAILLRNNSSYILFTTDEKISILLLRRLKTKRFECHSHSTMKFQFILFVQDHIQTTSYAHWHLCADLDSHSLNSVCFHSPIWRPHKGVCRWGDGGGAKVGQFDLPGLCQQNVTCLHIPEWWKKIKDNLWVTPTDAVTKHHML